MARVLVIDDEECIRFTFRNFLSSVGHEVICAKDFDEALSCVSKAEFELVFADIILKGRSGIDFLREWRGSGMSCPVVMITGYPSIETASEAVRLGAFDYIAKPVERDTLLRAAELALQYKRATAEKERYRLHLDAIFRSVQDMIVTVDNNLVITEINHAARRFCGLEDDPVGKDIRSFRSGCAQRCVEALAETIETRKPARTRRLECRHRGDPAQIVNVSTYPLMSRQGVFSGAIMVLRDETRLVRLEQDLGDRRRLHNILGHSRRMQKVYSLIEALADVDTTVLVTGESGTGKELVAEALHHVGKRRQNAMVRVNCSALPESLLESELFGHVRGAFTGAVSDRIGRFQKADGGTIFLDEIGDLSPRVQSNLLRVLQKKEIERIGDSTPIRVDVRVVAATNKNLLEMVGRGAFREDLLYRLTVVEVRLPPLRERRDDIPLLVEHFLEMFNKKMNKKIVGMSSEVETLFMQYSWPGNIRELEHAMEHAFVVCSQEIITLDHLPLQLKEVVPVQNPVPGSRHTVEPQSIIEALAKTAGNKKRAARLLGIDRKTLYRNIAKYGIAARLSSRDSHSATQVGQRRHTCVAVRGT